VYDGRGYRLLAVKEQLDQRAPVQAPSTHYLLQDRTQKTLLTIKRAEGLQARLHRALPLPLLIVVLIQTVDQELLAI
jgi:hypothetical protein